MSSAEPVPDMLAAPPRPPVGPSSPSSSQMSYQPLPLPIHKQESDEDCSSLESESEGGEGGQGEGCPAATTPVPASPSRHSPQQAHTPPDHRLPLNGFMSSMQQTLASLSGTASSPLVASPPAPAAASPLGNLATPLNLSLNSAQQPNPNCGSAGSGGRSAVQPPLVPQPAGMPQLILASGQIMQGIQGAQLLIPTSQGLVTQTILTIPLSAGQPPLAAPPASTPLHHYSNSMSPPAGVGLTQLMNGCAGGQVPSYPAGQSSPHLQAPPTLQQGLQPALQQGLQPGLQPALQAGLQPALQAGLHQHPMLQQGVQQAMQQAPLLQPKQESQQVPPPQQRSPHHHYSQQPQQASSGCMKGSSNGSVSGGSSPGSPLNTISRLAANNTDLTITTTSPSGGPQPPKRPQLSPSHLDLMDDPNQPMISESRGNTVDGINLDEIKEFAKAFKLRRLSLGLTQTQVGQALSITEGPAYSQSAICSALATQMYCAAQLASQQQSMFEKLDITPKSAQKIKPVLEQWMKEAEESDSFHRYKSGQNHLTEFIGVEPSKKRKRRTSFTPQALELLNAHFERNTHPSGTEITTLAHQLGYEREVIRIWFCNKRQALKNTVRMMSKGCT